MLVVIGIFCLCVCVIGTVLGGNIRDILRLAYHIQPEQVTFRPRDGGHAWHCHEVSACLALASGWSETFRYASDSYSDG